MRQSDGSEILGPNDPRNIVIGIIHVSPNDDRQSVVNAITAQDKMGRDQIVLDLPAQNKSFKTAVDFEGLHQMVGELEAAMVIVAPEKSKVANLARKESFTVYPSLEELAHAEFPPLEPDGTASSTVGPKPDAEMDSTMQFPLELPHAPSASAPAAVPVQPAVDTTPSASASPVLAPSNPMAVPPVSQPEQEEEEVTAPLVAGTGGPENPTLPLEEDEEPTDPAIAAASAGASLVQQTAVQVSMSPASDAQAASQPASGTPASSNLPIPIIIQPNAGAVVPSNPQLPTYYEPIDMSQPRRRSWRGLLITLITILVLIALGALFYRPLLDLFFPPSATVTLVPNSQQLQHTYQLTAVLGLPDPAKNQIDARALYASSQPQAQTVKATGQGHIAGQQASGSLTFYNASTSPQTIPAGTIIFDPNGLAVVNDQTVMLPALNTTTGLPEQTVSAHTVNTGLAQNIPADDFHSQLCCNGNVYVSNSQPFTGGQDQQNFTYVQQSDIDSVAQSMETAQAQQAMTTLQGQIRPNEKAAGGPRCAPQIKSDHSAGEQASSVTVTVVTSCVGEVYDVQAAQVLASRKLAQDAATNPGPSYAPVGNIVVQVVQAVPDTHGNVSLVTNAVGIWAYQFTQAQRAQLAHLIVGKSAQDARAILLRQAGVQSATITITGVGANVLPGNLKQITIDIEAVQGLHM